MGTCLPPPNYLLAYQVVDPGGTLLAEDYVPSQFAALDRSTARLAAAPASCQTEPGSCQLEGGTFQVKVMGYVEPLIKSGIGGLEIVMLSVNCFSNVLVYPIRSTFFPLTRSSTAWAGSS